jgi:Arc/MetJ family transcription regulator
MRTTVNLDDELLAQAMALSGIDEKTKVLHEALRSLVAREAGRRLAEMGGTAPETAAGRRRRSQRSARP